MFQKHLRGFYARGLIARFKTDRKGSAAVQFAMVAPLFFAVLFAIVEVSLVYFANQMLETGTRDAARLVLTHQAQDSSFSAAQFQSVVCNNVAILLNCNKVYVDVRSYPAGTAITPYTGLDNQGNFSPATVYQPPAAGSSSIVLVRTFYQWPLFITGLGFNLSSGGTNSRLLTATAAFRVEPGIAPGS